MLFWWSISLLLWTEGLSKYLTLLQIRNLLELFLTDVMENGSLFEVVIKFLHAVRLLSCYHFISFTVDFSSFFSFSSQIMFYNLLIISYTVVSINLLDPSSFSLVLGFAKTHLLNAASPTSRRMFSVPYKIFL